MRIRKALLPIVLVAVLTACGGGAPTGVSELKTDSVGLEKTDTLADVKFHVAYPVAGPAVLVDSLRLFIAQEINGDIELREDGEVLLGSAAQKEYGRLKATREEMAEDVMMSEFPPYAVNDDITIEDESDTYVTLLTQHYEYLGGAHGMTLVAGTTFSKADGSRQGWSMLTRTDTPEFLRLIREGVRSYFQDVCDHPLSDEELSDMLFLDSDESQIPLPSTPPYLLPDGVAFIYQQYEIAPYAAGLPSFTIAYDDIRPFLSDSALLLVPGE